MKSLKFAIPLNYKPKIVYLPTTCEKENTMTKNSKKDSSKSNIQSQYKSVEKTPEQISFEAEVQERIRQAKQQLKASSPFKNEEEENTQVNPSISTEQKTSADELNTAKLRINELESQISILQSKEQTTPSNTDIVELTIAKNRIIELEAQNKLIEAKFQSAQSISKETTTNVHTVELNNANNKIQSLEVQINELQSKLNNAIAEKNTATQALDNKSKSEKPKPIYGMAAAVPSTEQITKDDLKMEFLNFTSAHIDQFNTRIKKTEELIANQASHTPIETKSQKSYPTWLTWLNMALLGLVSILLLSKFLIDKNATNNLSNIPVTSNTAQDIKNEVVATSNNESNSSKSQSNQTTSNQPAKEEAVPVPNPSNVANKPTVSNVNSQPALITTPSANKTTTPVTIPTSNTATKPQAPTTNTPSSISKPLSTTPKPTLPSSNNVAKTATPAKPLSGSMKTAPSIAKSTPTPAPKPIAVNPPTPKQVIANKPITTTAKPVLAKPSPQTKIQTNKPFIAQSKPLPKATSNNAERDLEFLKEAIKPMDDNSVKTKTPINKTSKSTNTPSQPKQPTNTKKTTSGEGVYFGED
jgi:hypothetical protein